MSTTTPDSGSAGATAARLSIAINGEPRDVERGCSVRALLDQLGLGDRRVAVAINRDVVPRSGYDRTTISDGDRIEILEAVGGG